MFTFMEGLFKSTNDRNDAKWVKKLFEGLFANFKSWSEKCKEKKLKFAMAFFNGSLLRFEAANTTAASYLTLYITNNNCSSIAQLSSHDIIDFIELWIAEQWHRWSERRRPKKKKWKKRANWVKISIWINFVEQFLSDYSEINLASSVIAKKSKSIINLIAARHSAVGNWC